MDTCLIIICVAAAFALGAAVTIAIKRRGELAARTRLAELTNAQDALQSALLQANRAKAEAEQDLRDETSRLRTTYEARLAEACTQAESLDLRLREALAWIPDDALLAQLAEAESLRKRLKTMQDDLDEAQDDLDDAEKRLRRKDAEIVELQETVSRVQASSKERDEQLSAAKSELQRKLTELQLVKDSLDVIQEVFSAEEIPAGDAEQQNRSIDYLESFVKGQLADMNAWLHSTYSLTWNGLAGKEAADAKRRYFAEAFDKWASTKRKSWLAGRTTIALVGEFSAGKTSIVNRILSSDNPDVPQLPISTKATTAIPTYIVGDSRRSYSFVAGDGRRNAIHERAFRMVSKEILSMTSGMSSLIKYFVLTYDSPCLEGLSILDTPGFSSNDAADRERTIEVVNECDALFWVVDVNVGTINQSSILALKEVLNVPLYVVINKVDTKSDADALEVERLIGETLEAAGLHAQQFIRFSAKSPLEDITTAIRSVRKVASRDTFLADVRQDIEQTMAWLEAKVHEANLRYDKARQEGDAIADDYLGCLRSLQHDCDLAAGMPRWVEHFIGKNRYEMSATDGRYQKDLLNRIADTKVKAIGKKFDERVEKAAEIQQLWSELSDLKSAWQKVNDCLEQYWKLIP